METLRARHVAQVLPRAPFRDRAGREGQTIAHRDTTFEAIAGLLERQLPGFGELFRALSFQDIGSAAMLSRATAGTSGRAVVFVLPGSESAVRLAMEKLILPELGHIVRELRRST